MTTAGSAGPMSRIALQLLFRRVLLAIPIQPGDNILGQHEYLGIGGQMWVQVDGDGNAVPDFEGLGTAGHLYYITP